MAKRGRPRKVKTQPEVNEFAPVEFAEKKLTGNKTRIVLRKERLVEEEDARGRVQLVPRPWNHRLKVDGKVYNAGDELEVDANFAAELISAGTAQKAGTVLKPFKPKHLSKESLILTSGVVKRDDVIGKIPVYDPQKGNKGEWEDEDLDV